ncbi:Ribokinase-like protein [Dactylonectria estremocensis]|uniref:Ribokinase-like protein n=1 Tax=Dactylonectria estremocensis TaxID=1079267 RepID=A0A9P9JG50_9HYPO|nr:Ribokinase-like protein [Dactylonectria estremocensis]
MAQMEIDKVVETMIETAGNADIEFCLNAAPATPIDEHFCQHITHLLVNESEAAIMSGRERNENSKGAFYANATGDDHRPAFDAKVEYTTGARDTFTGAYSSDYVHQKANSAWDIKTAIFRANKAAAITIQTVGAQHSIPWADEIDHSNASYNVSNIVRSSSVAATDY